MLTYNPTLKRLGGYLIDAGLLTEAQVDVALCDQQATGMRFGDIVVERGWVKRQTIEYFADKIVDLEREIGEPLHLGLIKASFSFYHRNINL
ncbi:hypothetical protein [Altericista sp. CCNU0014]|uniref:hypothetical protein n=1 Tax=Altericista sp. CCNU0014 TaxID=3082949 RepID=UPI00384ADC54